MPEANTGIMTGQGPSMFTNAQGLTFNDSQFQIIQGDAYISNMSKDKPGMWLVKN